MQEKNSLTEGSIMKTLVSFCFPFLLANLLQALYGAVDLMVIGRYCPTESVAAVSTGTQVTQIITSMISGLTLSSTVLVGKYTGMDKKDKIRQTIGTAITFFGIFAIILTGILLACIPVILKLLQTPAASYKDAYQYIFICCLGIFFICEYNALSGILRGYGDSRNPLLFVFIACICNIIGDFITVGALGMGVKGTALSTICSQAVSMVIAVWFLNRKRFIFRFTPGNMKIEPGILKELLRIGFPVSLQECIVRFSFLYLTALTNGLGIYAACAVGVAGRYDVFAMLPAVSVSNALTALTAQNIGAGKPDRAKKFLKYGMLFALVCSGVFFVWAQLWPGSMLGLFTKDRAAIRTGIPFLQTCSLDYPATAVLFCFNGFLNGSERTVFTMASSLTGALFIRVPLLYAVSCFGFRSLGIYGIISPVSSVIMIGITGIYLYKINKMHTQKTSAGHMKRELAH